MELGFTYQNRINLVPKPKILKKRGPKIRGERKDQCKPIYCPYCNCYYQYRIASQHKKTLKHENNYLI